MTSLAPLRMDLLARRSAVTTSLSGRGKRSFTAAASNRLTNDWRSVGVSLDSILSGDLDKLRARAQDLGENNEYFQKFLTMLKCNVIGDCGMTLKNKAASPPKYDGGEIKPGELDKTANKLIEDAFYEWGKKENCTVTKDLTWVQVQHLAVEEWGTVGATLWEMMLGDEADNAFGFALNPISISRLDTRANHLLANGNVVKLGVEKNKMGRVVAYWISDSDPHDIFPTRGNAFNSVRKPAEKFVHLFLRRRIGQSQGFPWAAAAMLRLKMLAGYDIATITAAETAACKMAFITKNGTGVEYTGEKADDGGKYMDSEPGLIEELPQGMGVEVVDWNQPNPNYDPFIKACLRGMAAGMNVSYPNLANDYGEVNFSSGRMARMEETEFWKFVQGGMASDFHEPIFGKWLEMALANQAIKFPFPSGRESFLPLSKLKQFNQPNFHGRRWGWVDPTKEVAAIAEALRLKLTSYTRECATLGIDRDELFQEIESDKQAAEARGITLPDEAELAAAAQRLSEQQAQEQADAAEYSDKKSSENGNRFALNGHRK